MDNVTLDLRLISQYFEDDKNPLFHFSKPAVEVAPLTQAEMQEYLLQRQVFDVSVADEEVSFAAFSHA